MIGDAMMSLFCVERRFVTCANNATRVYVDERVRVLEHTGTTRHATSPRVIRGQPVTELIRRCASTAHVARGPDINRPSTLLDGPERPVSLKDLLFFLVRSSHFYAPSRVLFVIIPWHLWKLRTFVLHSGKRITR